MTESSFFQRRVNQVFLNVHPRHHQPGFDRAGGDAEHPGNLAHLVALHVMEHHHGPMFGGQAAQRLVQVKAAVLGSIQHGHVLLKRHPALVEPFTEHRVAGVDHDAGDPWPETADVAERIAALPCPHERFLHGVGAVVAVGQHRPGHAVQKPFQLGRLLQKGLGVHGIPPKRLSCASPDCLGYL